VTHEVEIIVSHKERLTRQYGAAVFSDLEGILHTLRQSIADSGMESHLLWIESVDPESVRTSILELTEEFSPRPTSVLLVGGDEVVPFFRLKNEVEDGDPYILSDSPYSSNGPDWLIPERAVGRVPGTRNAEYLLRILTSISEKHRAHRSRKKRGFGYSTSKWRAASKAVYTSIDLKEAIRLSPPVTKDNFRPRWLEKRAFLYFNLHGVRERSEWYGERTPSDPDSYPPFPVALLPKLVPEVDGACVFSEACYGGYVLDKEPQTSLALMFLYRNADCFAGSSAIAYGPCEPPSTEADLLCRYFLQYVARGASYGNAFMNAKRDFVKKMLRTQGYLDEDDAKTLLEFNLFGDPSLRWGGEEES